MQVRASAQSVRMSARKVQLVVEAVRGQTATQALAMLQFAPQAAARAVFKVIRSAMANAENNYSLDPAALVVVSATADQGPSFPPKFRPKARGQAGVVKRRTTHITVIVDDTPPVVARRPQRIGSRARKRPAAQQVPEASEAPEVAERPRVEE